MKFGIYFYPWYCEKRWHELPRYHTSLLGEYDSTDISVLNWQTDIIKDCGFDYIIIEVTPINDWGFNTCEQTIKNLLPILNKKKIGYSFLIDPAGKEFEHFDNVKKTIQYIEKMQWDKDLIYNTNLPVLFVYAPTKDTMQKINVEYKNIYEVIYPIYLENWGNPTGKDIENDNKNLLNDNSLSLKEQIENYGFVQFWTETSKIEKMNNICAVIPGYDDLLLNRNPQLAPMVFRNRGKTLETQFEKAISLKPDNIIMYGWNEYFETTTIEPTLDYGYLYVDIIKNLILSVKNKKQKNSNYEINCLRKMPMKMKYQYGEQPYLKLSDKYKSQVEIDFIVFKKSLKIEYKVRNTGTIDWNTNGNDVKLGVRFFNGNNVIYEQRIEIGKILINDEKIGKWEFCLDQIKEKVTKISVAMVYEAKFWFSDINSNQEKLWVNNV